jgi:hypothetical protein
MNNIIMRQVTVGAAYAPLVAESLVATVTLSCPPSNAGPVYFKGDDGGDVPWRAGEWHTLVRVNLVDILVKGTPGDVVTVIGGSW